MAALQTLILGGYGNFGARIARALAGDPDIALLIGGRDAQRAQAFAAELGGSARGVHIDAQAPDLGAQLHALGVGLVLHTAGPFQQQGYAVARAAAAAGAHYIDLADGRRFVCDFPAALDAAFCAAGRVGISGASTVPALSSAVVQALAADWQQVHAIDLCIAPAQTAPRGHATLAGVLDYCGAPMAVWDGGRWRQRHSWAQPQRVRFARLRPRRGALCDIPDLELFPAHFAVRDRVMFQAALEVGVTQWAFAALAGLRRLGLLSRPARLAGLLLRLAPWADPLGSALGGMVVRVAGRGAAGQPAQRAWHIAADHDHGPEIPCMAAILLARQLSRGVPFEAGARTALGCLQLADFEPEFARWRMVCDVVDEEPSHGASAA